MSNQNFKNHARYIPLWHFIIPTGILTVVICGIVTAMNSVHETRTIAILITILALALILVWFYARNFALRAQDRAIRAEENFRHFILTGKPHDTRLRLGQIIALRFASDGEMPALAIRAVEEKLAPKQIKTIIQQWRADYYRV